MTVFESLWSPPEGPDAPFGSTGLIILDSIRLVVFITGGISVLATPFAMARSHTPGQWVRLGAMGLFTVSAIGTEIDHFGDYAHWRLLIHIVGTITAAWGLWSLFQYETPADINEYMKNKSSPKIEEP